MLTANTEKEVIEKCLEAGVAMYLAKPIKSKSLLEAINYVLNHDELQHGRIEGGPVIDITQLHNYQDQNFLDEFIEIFKQSAEKLSADLNNSLVEDYETFKKVAHSIKGLSGNIGARLLREITTEAEGLSNDGYKTHSNKYAEKIMSELNRTKAELIKFSSKS
jgi:HPt (histidine-containing phosphotransfer) domain-containing protein